MTVESKGYNVAKVVIGTKLTSGEATAIGTAQDYEKLRELVGNSGLMRVKCTLKVGGVDMDFDGTCIANLWSDGIEFSTIVFNGADTSTPKIVGGQLYMDGTSLKCSINYCPVTVVTAKAARSKAE